MLALLKFIATCLLVIGSLLGIGAVLVISLPELPSWSYAMGISLLFISVSSLTRFYLRTLHF